MSLCAPGEEGYPPQIDQTLPPNDQNAQTGLLPENRGSSAGPTLAGNPTAQWHAQESQTGHAPASLGVPAKHGSRGSLESQLALGEPETPPPPYNEDGEEELLPERHIPGQVQGQVVLYGSNQHPGEGQPAPLPPIPSLGHPSGGGNEPPAHYGLVQPGSTQPFQNPCAENSQLAHYGYGQLPIGAPLAAMPVAPQVAASLPIGGQGQLVPYSPEWLSGTDFAMETAESSQQPAPNIHSADGQVVPFVPEQPGPDYQTQLLLATAWQLEDGQVVLWDSQGQPAYAVAVPPEFQALPLPSSVLQPAGQLVPFGTENPGPWTETQVVPGPEAPFVPSDQGHFTQNGPFSCGQPGQPIIPPLEIPGHELAQNELSWGQPAQQIENVFFVPSASSGCRLPLREGTAPPCLAAPTDAELLASGQAGKWQGHRGQQGPHGARAEAPTEGTAQQHRGQPQRSHRAEAQDGSGAEERGMAPPEYGMGHQVPPHPPVPLLDTQGGETHPQWGGQIFLTRPLFRQIRKLMPPHLPMKTLEMPRFQRTQKLPAQHQPAKIQR